MRPKIENGFWALGPNLTGYPGGYPQGFLSRMKKKGFVYGDVLHVFSGSVHEGITVDIDRRVKPTVVADAEHLPFRNDVFDTVLMDPPYSEEYAETLYGRPLVNVRIALKEACRVVKEGGRVSILDYRIRQPHSRRIR